MPRVAPVRSGRDEFDLLQSELRRLYFLVAGFLVLIALNTFELVERGRSINMFLCTLGLTFVVMRHIYEIGRMKQRQQDVLPKDDWAKTAA